MCRPSDNMDEPKSFFVNSDGLKIYCKYWYPQSSDYERLRAAVFICHGVGEHCQAYSKLASKLTDCDMLVFGHDHVGHGLSEGDRVHVSSNSTYPNDVIQHVNIIKNKHPNIPVFIIGHSMGGSVALKVAVDNKDMFAGMILLAPGLVSGSSVPSASLVQNFFGRTFANLFPQCQVKGMDPNLMSRDANIVKQYTDDPLVWHGRLKAKWAICQYDLFSELRSRLKEVTCPFFALHGTEDKLCDPSGSQMIYDNASSVHKQIKMYPGAYHQLHNEADGQGDEALSDIVKWILDIISLQA